MLFLMLLSPFFSTARAAESAVPWDDNGPVEYREPAYERIEAFKNNPDYVYDKDGERPGWFSRILSLLIGKLFQQVESSHWFRYVLLGCLILAFTFFVLRLLNVPIVSFITFARSGNGDELFEAAQADLSSDTALENLLALYRKNGAYREAVRILYLIYLKKLDRKGEIRLREFKTNREYAREIRDVLLRDQFSSLVKVYDYVWFGQFNPGEEQYKKIEGAFLNQTPDQHFLKNAHDA
ncbi:hypothetical protein JCM15548_11376 [Geofilum rubicundum JCM 15548]|uniref:Protein-glutamine gamma-glutamyltransferase-like C-terminal domain-containing protein n=1 Tax=Geofilum rubicundum JCM 15548 TaxID=1236989 RepID=A0A0E9LWF9_9BACT|nr:hypothetical protein JCM15548_11376 [Geofilum rubicundum JCM 15548]